MQGHSARPSTTDKLSMELSKLDRNQQSSNYSIHCQMGDLSCRVLTMIQADSLTHLNLARNKVGQCGANHLAKASWMAHLKSLTLSYNDLGADSNRYLAKANFQKLQQIFENGCKGNIFMFIPLMKWPTYVATLQMFNNSITHQQYMKFYAKWLLKKVVPAHVLKWQ